MLYKYRVVPFIGQIKGGSFSTDNAQTVSQQLEEVINTHAQAGWEFVGVEKIGIEVQPGCLGALLGQKSAHITFDQIVFRAVANATA